MDQLLLVFRRVDTLHGRAQGLQLVLRLLPLPVVDHLLHFLHLGLRGQHHLLVADSFGAEQRGMQAVERVTGPSGVNGSAETAEAQQRGSNRTDDRQ